jgi:alpha-N-arabinofuranosidase
MDAFIREVVATADHVAAKQRHTRKLQISFDEWNVWYQSRLRADMDRDWVEAPELIEDTYTGTDAVVVGDLLVTLLRHADRVGVACQAQLANVIAPIRTTTGGPAWRQSIFHPFALTARYARGTVLRTEPTGPTHHTARYGEVSTVDTVATHDAETGALAVFAVNRGDSDLTLDLDLRAFRSPNGAEHLAIDASDDVNDPAAPDRVTPITHEVPTVDSGRSSVRLRAASWNLIRYTTS